MVKHTKTSGIPEGRSPSYIPKHLKFYTVMKDKNQSLEQVSEQQFAQQHPVQYKAVNLYSYISSKQQKKKPLKKVKNIVGYNKSLSYIDDETQTIADYRWRDNKKGILHRAIVLPKLLIKEKENKELNNQSGKAMMQASSIAHEDIHSQQPESKLLSDEKQEKKYISRNTKYGVKKYKQLETEKEADVNKKKFKQTLFKTVDNPSSKEKIRKILGIKKGSSIEKVSQTSKRITRKQKR